MLSIAKDLIINMKIRHLINPFKCGPENRSYLYYAQPITFESMRRAQQACGNVELCAIGFDEDYDIVPDYFTSLPPLQRSTDSEFPYCAQGRKLPFLQDMFDAVNGDMDVFVFTNSDIGVQTDFYNDILRKLKSRKSFTINRRNNIPKDLTLDEILKHPGEDHVGHDCFVMSSDIFDKINLGKMFTGYPPWGTTLVKMLKGLDKDFTVFKDEHLTFHIGDQGNWGWKGMVPLWQKNIEESKKLLDH